MDIDEFRKYVSDRATAERVVFQIDVAMWHFGFDKIYEEIRKGDNPKDEEAIKFMLENKVTTNSLGYLHSKI